MLVLSREVDERVIIDEGRIAVQVVEVRGGKVKIGISAPADMRIDREEVHLARVRARKSRPSQ